MVDLSHRNGGFLWFFLEIHRVRSVRFGSCDWMKPEVYWIFLFCRPWKKIGSELGYVFQGLQKAKKGIALEFAFSRACKKQIGFFIGNLIFVCLMGGWLDRN